MEPGITDGVGRKTPPALQLGWYIASTAALASPRVISKFSSNLAQNLTTESSQDSRFLETMSQTCGRARRHAAKT